MNRGPLPLHGRVERADAGERRFILGSFAFGHLANDWAAGSIWLIAPAVAAAMGLGAPEVGLLLTINGIGAALAYVPAGMLADRIRRRGPVLVLTFWWVAAGYAAAAYAPGFWSLSILLAIAVMGDAAWHPIATGVLVQRYPERRAQVLGVHAMGGTIGAEVFAPLFVGLMLAWVDWRVALQLSVIPAALMGVAFLVVSRRLGECAPRPVSPGGLRVLLRAWASGPGRTFVATIVLYNMALIALMSMIPLFLQRDLGHTPLAAGALFAAMLLIGSLLQPLAGRLSDRVGRRPVLVPGIALGGVFALAAALLEPGAGTVAALVVAVAVLTAVRSAMLAVAVEIVREREATALAMAFTLMDGVGAVGAVLAGMAGREQLTMAFALAAGLAAASTVVALRLRLPSSAAAPVAASS